MIPIRRLFALIGFIVILFSLPSYALLPPVTGILGEMFAGRRAGIATEVTLKHRILVNVGEYVEVEERLVRERNQILVLWRVPSQQTQGIAASIDNQTYALSREKNFPTRSTLLVRYLLALSSEEFRDVLTAEKFVRRDQLLQYKPGFAPTGDPQTWNLKENYLQHDDIFLSRVGNGLSIGVAGTDSPEMKRVVYFDSKFRGIDRLEWKDGNQVAMWSMSQFQKSGPELYYPKRMSFEYSGTERVTTEVVSIRNLKDKQLFEYKNAWKTAARTPVVSSAVDGALRLLLSYR